MPKIFAPCSSLSKKDNRYINDLANRQLLRVHAIGITDPEMALALSDRTLNATLHLGRPDLEAKAYLLRAHSLFALGLWAAAYTCYVRAASHIPTQRLVEERTGECLEMIRNGVRGEPTGGASTPSQNSAGEDIDEEDIWLAIAEQQKTAEGTGSSSEVGGASDTGPKLRRAKGSSSLASQIVD